MLHNVLYSFEILPIMPKKALLEQKFDLAREVSLSIFSHQHYP